MVFVLIIDDHYSVIPSEAEESMVLKLRSLGYARNDICFLYRFLLFNGVAARIKTMKRNRRFRYRGRRPRRPAL